MNYFTQLVGLMMEVMLPLSLLVAAGAFWTRFFPDTSVDALRTQLNRLVLYLFYPAILFAVTAVTPVTGALLSVPLLVALGTLFNGALLYFLLYRSRMGRALEDRARAVLLVGGMFGNTFNIGVPTLIFFFGQDATRYAVFNDVLGSIPLVWSLGVWICACAAKHAGTSARPSLWREVALLPPIWAFVLGAAMHASGWIYMPLVNAARLIGQATIPAIIFVLGLTIPWRNLTPKPEIIAVAAVKLMAAPVMVWAAASFALGSLQEAHYASVVESAMPTMMTLLILSDRFRLDSGAAALLIGWSTILLWISLPFLMAAGLVH